MRLFSPDAMGRFVDRPNRFVMVVDLPDGSRIQAHAPNPGRMWELLYPGTELLLEKASSAGGSRRRTAWSVVAARRPLDGAVIPLVATGANRVARELVLPRLFPDYLAIRQEVTYGPSRFDFVVDTPDETIVVEVKSCTLEAHGVAMFPDAATDRGRRHVEELTDMTGVRRLVLFVVQGPRPRYFMPDIHTDPAFAVTLRNAVDRGVEVRVVTAQSRETGETKIVDFDVPLEWKPLEAVDADKGSYILHLRLDEAKAVRVGALGDHTFSKGHYLYVGSAMGSMRSRTDRHLRRRKRFRWHVDYLRTAADWAAVYRIYAQFPLECELSTALRGFMEEPVPGFGASDCSCRSHLFYAPEDPRRDRNFVETMLRFRHDLALQVPDG